jgi:hypothetical protein
MTYHIYEIKSENAGKINIFTKDDLVSRQSIFTRDSSSLDIDGNLFFVKIEGSKEGLKRADQIAKELQFKKLDVKKAEEINKKIEEQEDSAANGMGMIFG